MPGFEFYARLLADIRKVKIMTFSVPSLYLYSILLSFSSPSSEPQLEWGRSNVKEECLEKLKSCPPGSYNWLLRAVLWLSEELKEELGKCKWFSWHQLQKVSSVTPEIALSTHWQSCLQGLNQSFLNIFIYSICTVLLRLIVSICLKKIYKCVECYD